MIQVKDTLLKLVRLGIGLSEDISIPENVKWDDLKDIAIQQGLISVILDGIETFRLQGGNITLPEKRILVRWIGEVLQQENNSMMQLKAARDMALIFHNNNICTYVLKGPVVAECYPKPKHRYSVDLDCFLISDSGEHTKTWEKGNATMEDAGFDVGRDYYKNSTFHLPGLMVENHLYMIPFRGNKQLAALELLLESWIKEDEGTNKLEGTWLYRPPVMVSTLFLIEHAYSHFLHEGLTWRHMLDWIMFSKKHKNEIDWKELDEMINEFGFRLFYDSYYRLGKYLVGELTEEALLPADKRMLEDVWAPLDLHDTLHGVKGKLALAGNTWRARWKYKYFANINWLQALLIQAKGVLFDKHPKLDSITE